MKSVKFAIAGMAAILARLTVSAMTLGPTPEEMALAQEWMNRYLEAEPVVFPFSFTYQGQPSATLLRSWKTTRTTQKLDSFRTQHVLVYSDPATGLEKKWTPLYGPRDTENKIENQCLILVHYLLDSVLCQ